MNQAKSIKNFIMMVCIFVQGIATYSLKDIKPNEIVFAETPLFFQSLWYLIFYIFSWNFIFEISLVIVVHFKQNPFYAEQHSVINVMAVVTQLINNLVLMHKVGYNVGITFLLIEMGIMAAELIQFTLGGMLNKKLLSEKLVKGIFILRFLHKNWGRIIYIVTKFQIATYAYYYLQNSSISPFLFISLLFGLTAITHMTLWIILNAHATDDIEITNYLVNHSSKSQAYNDLLNNIESGEVDLNPENISISDRLSDMHKDHASVQLLNEQHSEIEWIIIEDKVFDITGLRHPKGNYILKTIRYRDITREIYGMKAWRFYENGYLKVSKHRHVARTFEFLKKHCIGPLSGNLTIVSAALPKKSSLSQVNSNLNLFESEEKIVIDPRRKRINSWNMTEQYNISDSASVYFLSKNEKDHVMNLSTFWLKNFGKYFIVRNKSNASDFYFVTLSLSPKYLADRKQWHEKLNYGFLRHLETRMSNCYKDLADISPALLNSVGKDFAALLSNTDEVRDPFLPLLHYNPEHPSSIFKTKSQFRVNGPIGMGMGFEPSSTKKILIMARDSGILPFADFFEYVGQRALVEINEMKNPHPIFDKEYLLYYINEISIWIYLEISDDFWEAAQVLGIFGLEVLNAVSKEGKFADQAHKDAVDFTKIVNVIKKMNIITGQPERNDSKMQWSNIAANDFNDVIASVAGADRGLINKVVVSGDMPFTNRVLKNVTLPSTQVFVL